MVVNVFTSCFKKASSLDPGKYLVVSISRFNPKGFMSVSWFSLLFHPLMFISIMVVSMFRSDFISATEAREMARRGGFEAMLFDVCDMCELKGLCAPDDCGAHLFPLDVNYEPSKPWSEL